MVLFVVVFVALAADVSGKWTYTSPAMGQMPERQVTITLKQDGDKLTGSAR